MEKVAPKRTSAIIVVAAIVVVIYGMQMMSVLLVPFLIAAFLALITARPMLWMQAHKVPSVLAALLIVFALMMFLPFVGSILGSSIADFTAALPAYQARLDVIVDGAFKLIVENFNLDEKVESVGDMIDPGWAMGLVANILNGLTDVLTNVFLIFFTMIFILLEASSMGTKVEAAFGQTARSLERPRAFLINLGRYLDTGLFLDHRETRKLVGGLVGGKVFLNLFAYTGSFTVYAAAGGARRSVTVDMSRTYQDWSRRNLVHNGLNDADRHTFIQADAMSFIERMISQNARFDVIVETAPDVVLLDANDNYKVRKVDESRGWNPQQGTMFYWNPLEPDTQFFFNDRDPDTGEVFAVLFDIGQGESVSLAKCWLTPPPLQCRPPRRRPAFAAARRRPA